MEIRDRPLSDRRYLLPNSTNIPIEREDVLGKFLGELLLHNFLQNSWNSGGPGRDIRAGAGRDGGRISLIWQGISPLACVYQAGTGRALRGSWAAARCGQLEVGGARPPRILVWAAKQIACCPHTPWIYDC